MFFFLKIVLATVLSIIMMGQAAASTIEARILANTASDDARWQAYLNDLTAQQPLRINGQVVKGYDPETGLVSLGAVMQHHCFNRMPEVQQACAKPGEQYVKFVARNGWADNTLTAAELRAQARERGIFFPFAAQAPVAAASAPTATTSTSVVAVTPEQLKALEASFAQVKQALEAQAAGNATAIAQLREGLAAKDGDIAKLREEMAKAPTAEAMTALKVELAAATTARKALERELKSQLNVVTEAAGAAATKAAAPAIARADQAVRSVSDVAARVQSADEKANTAKREANIAKREATTASDTASTARQLAIGGLVLAIVAVGAVLFFRRGQQVAIEKTINGRLDEALEGQMRSVNVVVGDLRDSVEKGLKTVTDRQREAGQNYNRVVNAINALGERVAVVESATGADAWNLREEDKEAIKVATELLAADEKSKPVAITIADGKTIHLTFFGIDADHVFVDGVKSLNNRARPVSKKRLYATIKGAYLRGELAGVEIPTLQLAA